MDFSASHMGFIIASYALTAVFLGSLAATVVFPFLGLVGLFLTMAAAGGTAVLARRLLVPPPEA